MFRKDATFLGVSEKIGKKTKGVKNYANVHYEVLQHYPYAQIAVQYEIERLSLDYGIKLMENIVRVLGMDVAKNLSFLGSHVKLDVKHTAQNEKLLLSWLTENPTTLDYLADAGTNILQAYGQYIDDCQED